MRGDGGAVIVETAFVLPVFVLLVFGVLEFGLLLRDHLTVANTTRSGARAASAAADDIDADHQILDAVEAGSAAMPAGGVKDIVIFNAGSVDGTVPETCKTSSSVALQCNHYTPSDFSRPEVEFGCTAATPAPGPDNFWCPTDRNVELSDPPDYIGVWVRAEHGFVTGLFGSAVTLTDEVIMRIEPRRA